MSRLFDVICCFASLAAPKFVASRASDSGDTSTRTLFRAPGVRPTETVIGRGSMIQLGPAMLVVDDAQAIAARVRVLGAARTETLNPIDFVTRVAAWMSASSSGQTGAPLVDYAVTGFPEVHLIAPDVSGATSGPSSGQTPAPAGSGSSPASSASSPQLGTFIASLVAAQAGHGGPPKLLRPFVEALSYSIVASLPLDAPGKLWPALSAAGIDTLGKLLDGDPEQMLRTALKGEHAEAFSTLLDVSEDVARTVVKVATDAVAVAASERQLTTRAQLTHAATAVAFAKLLGDRLKSARIDVAPSALASAIAEAASRGGS